MLIYKITNLITRKIYIGKTTTSMEIRWELHKKHAFMEYRTTKFCNTLRKHGQHNFEIQVLIDNITDPMILNETEIQKISEYDSTNPKIGYNMSSGGDGGFTQEMRDKSLSTRMKRGLSPTHMDALLTGRKKAGYRPKTPEEKQAMSMTIKQYYLDHPLHYQHICEINKNKAKSGDEHHRWGKTHTTEVKAILRTARLGKTYETLFGDTKAAQLKLNKKKCVGRKNPNYHDVDRKLLELLCVNPRLTRKELGVLLSCSGPTITNRTQTLLGIHNIQQYRNSQSNADLLIFFKAKLHEFIYNSTK